MITARNVDVGHLTQPGRQGPPLFTIARDDLVRIVVGVPEMYAAAVNPGDPAADPPPGPRRQGDRGQGRPDLLVPRPRNRTLRTEIDLPNPAGTLRPGLYVTRPSSSRSTRTP